MSQATRVCGHKAHVGASSNYTGAHFSVWEGLLELLEGFGEGYEAVRTRLAQVEEKPEALSE